MTQLKINEYLKTDIDKLKLFASETHAPVIFKLDTTSFNEDEMINTVQLKEHVIIGRIFPNSDIFKEGAFQIQIKVPPYYPLNPPKIYFITPIYHPSVGKDGEFYHELLLKTAQWTNRTSLVDVIKAIVERIDETDLYYSKNHEIIDEYTKNRTEFNRKALEMIKKHAIPRN
ncbi:unnamed protein product [Rotaria sordida]|uniref:UBC core domain-containing protein n=1 Tax=Rotaria sordida TaxID=392033 RepID=A0A819AX85_9BILA|nr:unnamed protein product [Rotaria sordida]CAF1290221.1 unnamed protein product [Rotaria sordida]CAF3783821.1 unnamed protein product [Rotaria sordida]CAF3952586.1 unnamed protein product [Rotaria sordida]